MSLGLQRVAIAAPHPAVRDSLRFLLGSEPGIDVIATVEDERAAARCLLQHHPDVLVLASAAALRDDGAEIRGLHVLAPATALVVVSTAPGSAVPGSAYTAVARSAGAAALVALDGPSEALLGAVRTATAAPSR